MIDFRIEDKGSETDMVYARYYYFVNKSSAYLVLLATTDKDRFMPEMMDVVRSVNYNWPEN